jgi:hypothetical protein
VVEQAGWRLWGPAPASTSLGETLPVEVADADALDTAMDWRLRRQGRIEAALAARHLTEGTFVLCALPSTSCEGHTCPVAQCGPRRDGTKGTGQRVVGLVGNAAGWPVARAVFPGNTGAPPTLAPLLPQLREPLQLRRLSNSNFDRELPKIAQF